MSWENEQALSRPPAFGTARFRCSNHGNNRHGNVINGNSNHDQESELFHESQAETIQYTYPLKLILPQHASSNCCKWLYPVTFGGGLVEGDNISLTTDVGERAAVLVTTQSSTKVFHCLEGKVTRQSFISIIASDALLALLPDPVVCFKDSKYQQKQDVRLSDVTSNLVLLDWYTSGRVARGEHWQLQSYSSSITITMADQVIFRDSQHLQDSSNLSLVTAMKNLQVLGTVILIGNALQSTICNLLSQYGAAKTYGSKYSATELVSISPITFQCNGDKQTGCYIKLAAPTSSRAFTIVDGMLKSLYPLLGGNPFENKY